MDVREVERTHDGEIRERAAQLCARGDRAVIFETLSTKQAAEFVYRALFQFKIDVDLAFGRSFRWR